MPPRPRPTPRPTAPRRPRPGPAPWWRLAAGALAAAALAIGAAGWSLTRRDRLAARAAAAGEAGDWPTAARLWHDLNNRPDAPAEPLRREAAAALAAGRAAQAEQALRRAVALDPHVAEPWLLLLELLRLEDRPVEVTRDGWAAYEAVPESGRREVLKALTLALLADTPDDLARRTLAGWITADPSDLDARAALLRRQAVAPRDGDPTRAERIALLTALLTGAPAHPGVREALILDLADAGEPTRGRELLDAWPGPTRDARFDRLLGRWRLDYDARPAEAIPALRRALEQVPHDWRTRYRLARALQAAGQEAEARRESGVVSALREALDPARLGPRLDADLGRLDEPAARLDLADLCDRAELNRLAEAWRRDAQAP